MNKQTKSETVLGRGIDCDRKITIMIEDFGSPEIKLTHLPHVRKEKAKHDQTDFDCSNMHSVI